MTKYLYSYLRLLSTKNITVTLLPLLIFVIAYLTFPEFIKNFWATESNKQWLSIIGYSLILLLGIGWIITHRAILFNDRKRISIVFMLAWVLILAQYSYVPAMILRYVVLLLCVLYVLKEKKIYLPTLPIVLLFAYGLLQQIGVLWATDVNWAYSWILSHQHVLLIVPVLMCLFRPTKQDITIFCALLFKFSLLILLWHIIAYLFVVLYADKSIFACFQFNKAYLYPISYYEVFRFIGEPHPSFLAWFFTIIGGIAYATWRQGERKLIDKSELFLYALLLLCFVFIVQARVGQLGFFIVAGFVVLLEIVSKIPKKWFLLLVFSGGIVFLLALYYIFTQTSFFSDHVRATMFSLAFESIQKHPFWGVGTLGEIPMIEKIQHLTDPNIHHLHNDFLTALVRHGVLGISLLIGWVVLMFYNSFLSKDLRLFFFMLPTVLIMLTDSALFYERILCITTTFLFMLFVPVKQHVKIIGTSSKKSGSQPQARMP